MCAPRPPPLDPRPGHLRGGVQLRAGARGAGRCRGVGPGLDRHAGPGHPRDRAGRGRAARLRRRPDLPRAMALVGHPRPGRHDTVSMPLPRLGQRGPTPSRAVPGPDRRRVHLPPLPPPVVRVSGCATFVRAAGAPAPPVDPAFAAWRDLPGAARHAPRSRPPPGRPRRVRSPAAHGPADARPAPRRDPGLAAGVAVPLADRRRDDPAGPSARSGRCLRPRDPRLAPDAPAPRDGRARARDPGHAGAAPVSARRYRSSLTSTPQTRSTRRPPSRRQPSAA